MEMFPFRSIVGGMQTQMGVCVFAAGCVIQVRVVGGTAAARAVPAASDSDVGTGSGGGGSGGGGPVAERRRRRRNRRRRRWIGWRIWRRIVAAAPWHSRGTTAYQPRLRFHEPPGGFGGLIPMVSRESVVADRGRRALAGRFWPKTHRGQRPYRRSSRNRHGPNPGRGLRPRAGNPFFSFWLARGIATPCAVRAAVTISRSALR